jgi:hypothetical protein
MAFTTEGKILDKLVSGFGVANTDATKQSIHLVWSAWPAVAAEIGKYVPTDKSIAVPFRQKLADLTKVNSGSITLIASAIYDLGQTGDIDQKYTDPNSYKAITTAASAATGGTILDKVLSPISALKDKWSYIKWGALGLGLIVLLWIGRPYFSVVAGFFKKKHSLIGSDKE